MTARLAILLACCAFAPLAGAAEIVRCAGAGGVTYQDSPCPDASRATSLAIPAEFPPPNLAERDRLLQREAAMYRRLEARRERELKEAALREERELERARVAAAAAAAAQPPQYTILFAPRPGPVRRPYPHRPIGIRP
jgi:xanthine dehydrogenase iron-sulfur cluster and FAD-binding subunit A